jgi:hypothetical protein
MDPATKSRVATGLTLILLGLGLYGMQYFEDLGESVVLTLLGGLCIAAYLYSRAYLLLVVGGIVLGLGIGSFGERSLYFLGEFSQIGLGVGFVLIYLIALLYQGRSSWWPLIPGVVFLLLGFRAWRRFRIFLFSEGWPLILVIIGALILLGAMGRGRRTRDKGEQTQGGQV